MNAVDIMSGRPSACVEVGASTTQTIVLAPDGSTSQVLPGAHRATDQSLLIAVPGMVQDGRVVNASNLGWFDVDPATELGLPGKADLVCNDAEAAAWGERQLRPEGPDLVYVGLGTGVGGAVLRGSVASTNLIGHLRGFGRDACRCRRHGCLETVASGWALPSPLRDPDLITLARHLAEAVDRTPEADGIKLVVLAGGLSRSYPDLRSHLADLLCSREVQASAAAPMAKSAAAWGLSHLWQRSQANEANTSDSLAY